MFSLWIIFYPLLIWLFVDINPLALLLMEVFNNCNNVSSNAIIPASWGCFALIWMCHWYNLLHCLVSTQIVLKSYMTYSSHNFHKVHCFPYLKISVSLNDMTISPEIVMCQHMLGRNSTTHSFSKNIIWDSVD